MAHIDSSKTPFTRNAKYLKQQFGNILKVKIEPCFFLNISMSKWFKLQKVKQNISGKQIKMFQLINKKFLWVLSKLLFVFLIRYEL